MAHTTKKRITHIIRDADQFKDGSLRNSEVPSIKGVSLTQGKLKHHLSSQDEMENHAIHFSRKHFKINDANNFFNKHKDQLHDAKSFYNAHLNGLCDVCKDSYGHLLDALPTIKFDNLIIEIEYSPKDIRFDGTDHEVEMRDYYGRIKFHEGIDGDMLDAYVGHDRNSKLIFKVPQLRKQSDAKTELDEYKYFFYFTTIEDAEASYKYHIKDPEMFGGISEVQLDEINNYFTEKELTDSNQSIQVNNLIAKVVKSKKLTDAVESIILFTQADVENGNNRAYSDASLAETTAEFNQELALLGAEVFLEHPEGLYDEEGELDDFKRRQNPLLANFKAAWYSPDNKKAKAIIRWRNDTPQGQDYAQRALDLQAGKNVDPIHFSLRAKKKRCYKKNGQVVCDIDKIFGADVVSDPAMPSATILHSAIVDSNNIINKKKVTTLTLEHLARDELLYDCNGSGSCGCADCSNSQSIAPAVKVETDSLLLIVGESKMYASQIKQWHSAGVSRDSVMTLLKAQPFGCDADDLDAALAYYDSLGKGGDGGSDTPKVETDAAAPTGEKEKETDATTLPKPPAPNTTPPPKFADATTLPKPPAPNTTPPPKFTDEDQPGNQGIPDSFLEELKEDFPGDGGWDEAREILVASKMYSEEEINAAGERWSSITSSSDPDEADEPGEEEDESYDAKEDDGKDKEPPKKPDDKEKDKSTVTDARKKQLIDRAKQVAATITDSNSKKDDDMSKELNARLQALTDKLEPLVVDREKSKAQQSFLDSIEARFTGENAYECKDNEKNELRNIAKNAKNGELGLELLDYEIGKRKKDKSNQKAVDAQRDKMGFGRTGASGSTITTEEKDAIDSAQEIFDNIHAAMINGYRSGEFKSDNPDPNDNQIARIEARKKFFDKSLFKQQVQNHWLTVGGGINDQALRDAISTSTDIHGLGTVFNRDTVLEWAIIMQTFFHTTITESICMALGPGAIQQRFPMNGGNGKPVAGANLARPQDLGGTFVMGLEDQQEDPVALNNNYKIARNAGIIPLVNTRFKHNVFVTSSRMAGIVSDMEVARQMVTGPFNYDVAARAIFNATRALGRSIDTELGQDMIYTTREVGAVQVLNETPAGNGTSTGEWFYNGSGHAADYGLNIKGVVSLLAGRPTTELKTSWEHGDYYPAPTVNPRVKTYINGLTGETTDTILFPFTVTLPTSAGTPTPRLGFLDPDDLQAKNSVTGGTDDVDLCLDLINGRALFTGNWTNNNMDATHKPIITEYWYSTNLVYWSRANGRWDITTNTFISGAIAGLPVPKRGRAYLDEVAQIVGDVTEEKQKTPDFQLATFSFQNGYVGRAESFEKRISITDAELEAGWAPGIILGTDGSVVQAKTSNPRWSKSPITISGMGAASSALIGQRGSTFYGLGYIYPDMGMVRARYAPSGGGITQAVNAMQREMGFLDTVGTPVYFDGRNFSYKEVIIVD